MYVLYLKTDIELGTNINSEYYHQKKKWNLLNEMRIIYSYKKGEKT